jgi:hypothetical protein
MPAGIVSIIPVEPCCIEPPPSPEPPPPFAPEFLLGAKQFLLFPPPPPFAVIPAKVLLPPTNPPPGLHCPCGPGSPVPPSPTTTVKVPIPIFALEIYTTPPPPPPPVSELPPPPPPPTKRTSTGKFEVVPFLDSIGATVKVALPVVVKVCTANPPDTTLVPPVIFELAVLAVNIGKGRLAKPKLFLTLLTKGIYFSLEVEVSRS